MPTLTDYDTIAAISTPIGEGAISIVRLSGDDAVKIANHFFKGKDLNKVASHTINYGHFINPDDNQIVDEVMISVMRAPKTFTREDVIEINCHGGMVATNKILQLLISGGARLAEPGEYSKRAFLNGRIDLTQAESIMDLIRAKTDRAMQIAVDQLDGSLTNLIKNLRREILDVLANVEVNIDYPEYDTDEMTTKMLLEKAEMVSGQIDNLLKTAQQGKIMRHGLATAIIGRPNVGKSSLLNYLTKEEKAIVTDVAGTTRDTLEEYVSVNGVPLKLIDTAGIHETEDVVEKIGVERSINSIEKADLILLLIDGSSPLQDEDRRLLDLTEHKKRIIILNKIDLVEDIDNLRQISDELKDDVVITTSILNREGLKNLEENIANMFFDGIEDSNQTVMVTNARQVGLLKQAKSSLNEVINGIKSDMPIDLVQIDMTACWDRLGEITGESAPDELITQLFTNFCLGK